MPTYFSSCKSVEEVQLASTLLPTGVGLASAFTYRYTFKPSLLVGLNKLDILLLYGRPVGNGALAHVLTSGVRPTDLRPCTKGRMEITGGTLAGKFSTDDAYLIQAEGKLTVENWAYVDTINFLFFNYTTAP